jgi:hypothetical protein
MSKNPINLALRFSLEMMALVSFGIFGFRLWEGVFGVLAAILLPLCFAIIIHNLWSLDRLRWLLRH